LRLAAQLDQLPLQGQAAAGQAAQICITQPCEIRPGLNPGLLEHRLFAGEVAWQRVRG